MIRFIGLFIMCALFYMFTKELTYRNSEQEFIFMWGWIAGIVCGWIVRAVE